MCAVIHQRLVIGQYSMIGANNTLTKNVFPYYININNKSTRLNTKKIDDITIIENDTKLKEIYNNFLNKNYDLSNYDLYYKINEVLSIFINNVIC